MSIEPALGPLCSERDGAVALVIKPRARDLGEFAVRRVLPADARKMVGPFVFFDHFGPAEFPPGQGIQVRPHPHIGLATMTYLFIGEIIHRDSLGYTQAIRPGAVNLMTAGSGITHSERAGDDLHEQSVLDGIQTWLALPAEQQERAPDFRHIAAADIPRVEVDGVGVHVVMGSAFGQTSPVPVYSPTLYLDCKVPAGRAIGLPEDVEELAVYIVTGEVEIDGQRYASGVMAVACPGTHLRVAAHTAAHLIVIGGAPLGERHVWWNFVSTSRERIAQAKADWQAGRFAPVPDDAEFIPLPED
jgi:redox-sensitive bicupin YhaK (pirin superfamily)